MRKLGRVTLTLSVGRQDWLVMLGLTLLDHLATLTPQNNIQYGTDGPVVPTLAVPTPTQRRVFELLATTIPLNLE